MIHLADRFIGRLGAYETVKRASNRLAVTLRVPISPALVPNSIFLSSHGRPLTRPRNAKLVVIGLPKSGNTWLLSLLRDYLELPALRNVSAKREKSSRGIGMTHEPLSRRLRRRRDFVHAVYIVRDVRDSIVSFFHYAQTDYFRDPQPDFHYDDFDSFYFEWFLSRMVPRYRWSTHADEYAQAGVPVVRYERLWDQPEAELIRLIRRLGFPVDPARATSVVTDNLIQRVKKTGKDLNVAIPPTHFRKGGHGGYREEMPAHILADVNDRFGGLLKRWGYVTAPHTSDVRGVAGQRPTSHGAGGA